MESLKREIAASIALTKSDLAKKSQLEELPEVPLQQLEFQVDETEAKRSETLYSAVANPEFNPRKTEPKDISILMTFVTQDTEDVFASADVGMVYERSCFSLVLLDQIETGKLVAHASFSDSPMDPVIDMDWENEPEFENITPFNTLFMHLFVFSPQYTPDTCLTELIANTFLSCTGISNLILECPTVEYEGPYLFTPLARSAIYTPNPKVRKKLILYQKDTLFPHLIVREGREHDLDDLAPQMALTPKEMEENFAGRCYLSDLVALSDRNNQSIVAEHENQAVGIAIVTTDINYKFLNHHFHLEAFHGLYRPHDDDIVHIEAQQSTLFEKSESEDEEEIKDNFMDTPTKDMSRVFREENESEEGNTPVEPRLSEAPGSEIVQEQKPKKRKSKRVPPPPPEVPEAALATPRDTTTTPDTDHGEARLTETHPLQVTVTASEQPAPKYKRFVKLSPQYKRSEELEFEHSIRKSESAQLRLLEQVDEITRELEENGLTEETARFDESSLKALQDAEDFIQSVANTYLHRVLIDEKILPIDDWNEPPISRYIGLPNAIAIQLLTMDKRFYTRFEDLIQNTFLKFPNRDYVIITVPSYLPEPHWAKYFTPVPKRKDSIYAKSLYVLHRITFSSSIIVRTPTEYDLENIETFLSTIVGGDKILADVERSIYHNWTAEQQSEAFLSTASMSVTRDTEKPMLSFIMTARDYYDVDHILVGLAIISHEPEPAYYQVNYDMDGYSYANDHHPSDYGYIHHFLLSPLFQMHSRFFMKEVLRQTKKQFAVHKLLPFPEVKKAGVHQSILNNIEDWVPLGPRKRINYNHMNLKDIYDEDRQPSPAAQDYNNPSAAIFFSKKFLFDTKPKVGARIVFIGASDTTIAAVEKLVYGSHLTFKHLTIISPHGLPGSLSPDPNRNLFFPRNGSPSLSMTSDDEWHHRLGLRNHVNVVYGTVTKLLRTMKMVLVNETKVVRYDLLIICAGRQFVRPDCPTPKIQDEHFAKYHEYINVKIASDYTENREFDVVKPVNSPAPEKVVPQTKPYNVFLINMDLDAAVALSFLRDYIPLNTQRHIIIHGACLEAYCCITALLRLHLDAKRIVLVTTPDDDEGMDWENWHGYKNTPKLKEVIQNSLTALGVRVVKNYVFHSWNVEATSNLATRIFFTSPSEEEAKKISISCLAYFPFVVRRVADETASVFTECFLGYNDGVLIDTAFQTLDEHIWAAGPCSTYNKALCADQYFHGFYSSYEIGRLLADLVIKMYDPTADISVVNLVKPGKSLLPPLFTAPIVRYAELPDGWYYLHMRRPGVHEQCCHGECTCADCECGTEVVTGSLDDQTFMSTHRYFRLWLNSFHRVEGLECVSRMEFSPSNFTSLYGHHEAFLNRLLESVEKGEVHDLYVFFEQPWIGAICHDRWIDFREELQETYTNYDIGPNFKIYNFIRDYLDNLDNPNSFKVDSNILRRIFENSGMKSVVELKFLEFLKYNRAVIPMFARPDFVEQMFEEREKSAVYFPQVPNF